MKGICQLCDRLYVVCDGSNSLRVYHSFQPFSHIEDVEIKELKSPQDVASCDKRLLLYISDGSNNCIWRVTTDFMVDRWMDGVGAPFTLSVIAEERFLMSGITEDTPSLNIFAPDGALLQRLSLPNDVIDLQHSIQSTTPGNFLVSHGQPRDDEMTSSRLCEVSKEGQLIRTNSEIVLQPAYIVSDNEGRIIMSDMSRDQILMFDRQLKLQRVLVSPDFDEVRQPQRLCYISKSGHLLIGSAKGNVHIFCIR